MGQSAACTETVCEEPQTQISEIKTLFEHHRNFYRKNPYPSFEYRAHLLKALKDAVLASKDALCNAVHQDFGNRSASETLLLEVMQVIDHINHTLRNLKSWMKPESRLLPLQLMPGQSQILPQPKGIIGIISPWNYPILLSLTPLATAISAGNTAIVKTSEFTPHTNAVLKNICDAVFDGKNASVIEGDATVAAQFCALPFNHLFFTGSCAVGKKVMKAASENLTPVTLELGGKSPVIIDRQYDIQKAAASIAFGKGINAGQTCIAPDYILCPKDQVSKLCDALKNAYQSMYGTNPENEDYTAIISKKHFDRLKGLLKDAVSQGAKAIHLMEPSTQAETQKKMPLTLLTDTNADMDVMQEEIFGPLLPIIAYENHEEAINYIEDRAPPLALYLMSDSTKVQTQFQQLTHAGGMCINDTLTHVASQNLPFGGMGASGIGCYHGKEGFDELSHKKSILKRGRWNPTLLISPPWNKKIHQMILKVFVK